MATFKITIEDKNNLPPDQLGNLSLEVAHGGSYVFTNNDFTINTVPPYSDPEDDNPKTLKIFNYPNSSHKIELLGVEVIENQEISFTDIINSNLVFIPDNNIITSDEFNFSFDIADEGSNTFSNLEGTVNISINARINQPPSQIGDGSATVQDDNVITFTTTMFTATTPEYQDPENDLPGLLKIISLPSNGDLLLNNELVVANDIIDFNLIDSGKLVFRPDNVDQDIIDNFEYQIADRGSNIFIG